MRAFPHQEEQQMTLNSHDGLTPDGIAEAFIEFAKKEGLSFFQ